MITIAIIWRPQPGRERAHDVVSAHWRHLFPSAEVVDIDTGDEQFNRAACRNAGVLHAQRSSAGIVIISDADTIADGGSVKAAVAAASCDGLVHLPYAMCRVLSAAGTQSYLTGTPLPSCDYVEFPRSCSGVYVTTPATWWAHGGQDPGFRGWGFEDTAWAIAHTTLLGAGPIHHPGYIYTLYHPPSIKKGTQYEANAARCRLYSRVADNPAALRALTRDGDHRNGCQ